jgi:transcriptional regulator with XRE-family HTH domain
LGTEQRDLAAAAKVTQSYISQLLTGKKAPPTPERTDIYDKMERKNRTMKTGSGSSLGLTDRTYEQMRVIVLEFLEADIFNVSVDNCVTFLDPLIESWDIDLATFGMEIVLNRHLAPGHPKKFGFVELEPAASVDEEPGLQAFLEDPDLRGDATAKEIEFLKKLRFTLERPTPLYYYRELQNLRDPLHFRRATRRGSLSVDVD